MIERIDHILARVENFEEAQRICKETSCPVAWDGFFEGPVETMSLHAISIGPVNLEIVFTQWSKKFGISSVAFDQPE
jgi:hypothetical protein